MGQIVYKYVTAERIDVLKDNRIRFTQAAALNDPFESMPDLSQFKRDKSGNIKALRDAGIRDEDIEKSEFFREVVIDVLTDRLHESMGGAFAFLSLSQINDNLLMWAYYTDCHKGFVIGFDSENEFFSPGYLSRGGLQPVNYQANRFVLPPAGFNGLTHDEMEGANEQYFFTKSEHWKHERELRIVAEPPRADKTIQPEGQLPIHLFRFPVEAVREIIFGYRISPELRNELVGLAEEKYPHASLVQAELNRHRFSLDFTLYKQFLAREEALSPIREMFKYKLIMMPGPPSASD